VGSHHARTNPAIPNFAALKSFRHFEDYPDWVALETAYFRNSGQAGRNCFYSVEVFGSIPIHVLHYQGCQFSSCASSSSHVISTEHVLLIPTQGFEKRHIAVNTGCEISQRLPLAFFTPPDQPSTHCQPKVLRRPCRLATGMKELATSVCLCAAPYIRDCW
jgi:hypothetical protein